jgi:hypothetical protein
MPHTQRYLGDGAPLLTLSNWNAEAALVLAGCLPN